MIFTIIGDPHCTPKNMDKIRELFNQAIRIGHPIIILGDLLDTKSVIRSECLNLYYEIFSNTSIEIIALVGNHDLHNVTSEKHSLETLKSLPNVTIIDDLTVIHGMYFLPYIHDQDKLKATLKEIPKDSIVFGHFEIKSFDFGNGRTCDNGITTKSFTRFKRVISGHFHKYQQKGNLTYLGTPFSHTFGEANQDKFLGRYSLNEDKLELLPTRFPAHLSYEHNCDIGTTIVVGGNGENHVRLILTGAQENIDKAKALNTFHDSIKVIERSTDELNNQAAIDDTADNLAQFNTWATDIQQLDAETIKLGLQILGAVNGR